MMSSWSGRVGTFDIALGHPRLPIIDLTEAGHLPILLPTAAKHLCFKRFLAQ